MKKHPRSSSATVLALGIILPLAVFAAGAISARQSAGTDGTDDGIVKNPKMYPRSGGGAGVAQPKIANCGEGTAITPWVPTSPPWFCCDENVSPQIFFSQHALPAWGDNYCAPTSAYIILQHLDNNTSTVNLITAGATSTVDLLADLMGTEALSGTEISKFHLAIATFLGNKGYKGHTTPTGQCHFRPAITCVNDIICLTGSCTFTGASCTANTAAVDCPTKKCQIAQTFCVTNDQCTLPDDTCTALDTCTGYVASDHCDILAGAGIYDFTMDVYGNRDLDQIPNGYFQINGFNYEGHQRGMTYSELAAAVRNNSSIFMGVIAPDTTKGHVMVVTAINNNAEANGRYKILFSDPWRAREIVLEIDVNGDIWDFQGRHLIQQQVIVLK